MFAASDLHFAFDGVTPVLNGLSLSVNEGEIISLLGPSGCGKSTALRVVSGLLRQSSGEIEWEAEPSLGFVFQDHALMPWADVSDNVTLPGRLNGRNDETQVHDALRSVGLAGYEKRYPAELSGGQRMRVSLARALAAEANLLLMDEPFAALDEILRFQMNELLLELREKRHFGVLFVTHSIYEAAYLSDHVAVMAGGAVKGMVSPTLDRSLSPDQQRVSQQFVSACQQIGALMREEQE